MSVLPPSALVVGLGVSGAAAATALLDAGVTVRVADSGEPARLADRAAALRARGADVRLGHLTAALLDGCGLVVTSPGVPPRHPLLAAAVAAGVPVWSEPELAWRLADGRTRVVAITGTNGKTTTTELVAACLGAPAGGNIGAPLCALLAADPPPLVVAELSSFQLHHSPTLRAEVGVLLNVAPDHLDWHGTEHDYAAAKARVWTNQGSADTAVAVVDDRGVMAMLAAHPPPGRLVTVTTRAPVAGQVGVADGWIVARLDGEPVGVVAVADLGVRGWHNVANAVAAVAASLAAGANPDALGSPLRAVRSGPHRLELVAVVAGVTYVNDSKATNPHAAAAALATYDRVVWIAGGLTKGLAFDPLADVVRDRVSAAVTIGSGGHEVAAFTRGLGIHTVETGTLAVAVPAAAALAGAGDTVLLAPACASMDQFADYAERGAAFRAAVAAVGASHVG